MASDGLPSGTFGRKRFIVGSGNRDRDGVRGVESYGWVIWEDRRISVNWPRLGHFKDPLGIHEFYKQYR